MRQASVVLSLVLLAGCASQPPGTYSMNEEAAESAVPDAAKTQRARELSHYRVSTRNGEKVYCRDEPRTGSKFRKETCVTEDEYEQLKQETETDVARTQRCGAEGCAR